MKKKIAPSILSADFSRLGEEIVEVEKAGADYIHIDVMDGHFVPNITIGPMIVKAVKKCTDLPLDVHLMVENPDLYIREFVSAGGNIITVHSEATAATHLHRIVQLIKEVGAKAGVALNPATPLSVLDYVLDDLDMVTIMSVNPGFGGQSLINSALNKIPFLKRMIDKRGLHHIEIEVDGGIKVDNIASVAKAGADVFVAGSAVFGSDNYKKTISAMKDEIR